MKKYLVCIALLGVAAVSAKEKKVLGEVSDRGGLVKVRSYCLELGNLTAEQALDVGRFIEEESKPKRALANLPWSHVVDCAKADAAVAVKFEETMEPTEVGGYLRGQVYSSGVGEMAYRATLLVTDRASKKVLYLVAGAKRKGRRERTLATAFSKLLKGLETVQESGGH